MIGVIRAEVLRAHSGANTLAVLLLAAFIPVIVLTSDDTLGRMTSLDADTAAALTFAPLAWSFVAAAFGDTVPKSAFKCAWPPPPSSGATRIPVCLPGC